MVVPFRVSASSGQFQAHAAQGEPRVYHKGFTGSSHISSSRHPLFLVLWLKKVQVLPPCGAAHYDWVQLGARVAAPRKEKHQGFSPPHTPSLEYVGVPFSSSFEYSVCPEPRHAGVRLPDGPCPQTLPRALPSGEGGVPRVLCCLLLTCRSGIQAPRDIQEGKYEKIITILVVPAVLIPQPQSACYCSRLREPG